MESTATLILAQHSQNAPSTGAGIGIIVAVLVVLILGALALHFLVASRSRASKGGVQPPKAERDTRHGPPFESVEHRS